MIDVGIPLLSSRSELLMTVWSQRPSFQLHLNVNFWLFSALCSSSDEILSKEEIGSNESHSSLWWLLKCHQLLFRYTLYKIKERERGRERWLPVRRYVRQQKQTGFVCFIRVFEDAQVRNGSAKGGSRADILATTKDLHTSPRNVWICLGDIHTSLGNVIIFECDCTESYQTTDHQSLLFSRVSRYSSLIILYWERHEWEMPCHLFHESLLK